MIGRSINLSAPGTERRKVRKIGEEEKVEIDGRQIAEQVMKNLNRKPCRRKRDDDPTISTNKLHKLVLDNGIKLDEKEIKGVRSYSIKQDEDEMIAKLTLFMDVRII